jgi:hypothetical protein
LNLGVTDVKQKRMAHQNTFWNHSLWKIMIRPWCTIADVKITFPDDPEGDIEEIRALLDSKTDAEESSL